MAQASVYVDDKNLVVVYGDDKSITMELETDAERELVRGLIDDVNLWASFLSSLSAALNRDNHEIRDV